MKSGSGSLAVKPKITRTLRRGGHVEEINADHMKWLFAAYRKGAFDWFPEGLDPKGFDEKFFSEFETHGGVILFDAKDQPFGYVAVAMHPQSPRIIEPHVFWFPWASVRNKIEGAVRFISEAGKQYKVMIYTSLEDKELYVHVARHGLLRRVGTVHDYFHENQKLAVFESKGV